MQTLPADPALTVAVERRGSQLLLGVSLGEDDPQVYRERLRDAPDPAPDAGRYWSGYWSRLPDLTTGDGEWDEILHYGLWKLGALTTPAGVPATLQGPWMEEHRIPLWSNDYHFNINLEMIYWPCLHLGLGDHLRPLWSMVHAWMPQLRANGERFFETDGALMLPHAVDDRCHPIGSFWQGSIDHASTAWMAQMAWLDYAAHGDPWVLHEIAWPLLTGAFEGYAAMREGDRLPISVSTEWGEGAPGTWGANASFQLAALHMVCRLLPEAARAAGRPADPRWAQVAATVPPYATVEVPPGVYDLPCDVPRRRIALWEGQDLTESHRHHSHLAGLYPFATLRADDPVVEETLRHWSDLGGGRWSSWGAMWAVCLMARVGWTDGARAWLKFALAGCLNEGKSLSAGAARGVYVSWGSPEQARRYAASGEDHEVMQLDANLGLITALIELSRPPVGA